MNECCIFRIKRSGPHDVVRAQGQGVHPVSVAVKCPTQCSLVDTKVDILAATIIRLVTNIILLAGQITRRVAPSVAPSTGCSIIIIILFFRMNIVH